MYKRSVRIPSRSLLIMVMITLATTSVMAQISVSEKGAQLQVVSEIGAGEGPAWNPAVALVSSYGSVYLQHVVPHTDQATEPSRNGQLIAVKTELFRYDFVMLWIHFRRNKHPV